MFPRIKNLIEKEATRMEATIELVASENYISKDQLFALGSILCDTTIEGYENKRFLWASSFVDEIENASVEAARSLFKAKYANVQPHSGTQANQAIFKALLQPDDCVLAMSPDSGGHFSHGGKGTIYKDWIKFITYGVDANTGLIDYDLIFRLAKKHRPKIIFVGASSYPRRFDFEELKHISESVNSYLIADIAHVAGLVATQHFPHPFPYVDIVTTTTYKNLRGPRGGLILTNNKSLANLIDAAIFPGIQGTPLVNSIAAKAIAFSEAMQPDYYQYSEDVLLNARFLSDFFLNRGIPILTGGTDTPLFVLNLKSFKTPVKTIVHELRNLGINTNACPVPGDASFEQAHGLRIGTSAITTRGFRIEECEILGNIISDVIISTEKKSLAQSKIEGYKEILNNICQQHPIYPIC